MHYWFVCYLTCLRSGWINLQNKMWKLSCFYLHRLFHLFLRFLLPLIYSTNPSFMDAGCIGLVVIDNMFSSLTKVRNWTPRTSQHWYLTMLVINNEFPVKDSLYFTMYIKFIKNQLVTWLICTDITWLLWKQVLTWQDNEI